MITFKVFWSVVVNQSLSVENEKQLQTGFTFQTRLKGRRLGTELQSDDILDINHSSSMMRTQVIASFISDQFYDTLQTARPGNRSRPNDDRKLTFCY